MSVKSNLRNSNIEFLRICAMLMIIGLHYLHGSMGGALEYIEYGSWNYYVSQVAETVCIISVNIFVLITGYYMASRKSNYEIGISKPINLYIIMAFYGFLFLGIAIVLGKQEISATIILRTTFPFLYSKRWFVETYIILLLLSPYLNKLLVSLSKKNYLVLLLIWISLFSVWPSFFSNPPIKDGGYGFIHFITLYMISGFIRLHIDLPKKRWKKCLLLLTAIGCITGTYLIRNHFNGWSYDFILNIVSATCILIWFLTLKERNNRIVNCIASTTFGVFLIHTDFSLTEFIYQDVLHCSEYCQSAWFAVHLIASVLFLFVIGSIIDFGRQFLWKYTFDKWLSKVNVKIKA